MAMGHFLRGRKKPWQRGQLTTKFLCPDPIYYLGFQRMRMWEIAVDFIYCAVYLFRAQLCGQTLF